MVGEQSKGNKPVQPVAPSEEESDNEEVEKLMQDALLQLQQEVLKLQTRQARITKVGNKSSDTPVIVASQSRKVKLKEPPRFGRNKRELPGWLASIRAYTRFYEDDFTNPADIILFAESFLEGAPKRLFEPTLDTYLNKAPTEQDPLTQSIFDEGGFVIFGNEITKIFGEADDVRAAEERIQHLKQTGSAAAYASALRQESFRD
ncbi:hypothetical protein V8F33_005837 [Rhypophila sp. PSN 637]